MCDQAISQIIQNQSDIERDTEIEIKGVNELSELLKNGNLSPSVGKKKTINDDIEIHSNMLESFRNELENQEQITNEYKLSMPKDQPKDPSALSPSDSMPFEFRPSGVKASSKMTDSDLRMS